MRSVLNIQRIHSVSSLTILAILFVQQNTNIDYNNRKSRQNNIMMNGNQTYKMKIFMITFPVKVLIHLKFKLLLTYSAPCQNSKPWLTHNMCIPGSKNTLESSNVLIVRHATSNCFVSHQANKTYVNQASLNITGMMIPIRRRYGH